ncbi:protein tyrosine phosphatase [Bacteroides coprosuis DSM 18011]|uniref:Protein tyrosine phosphatase n=1 Tax=Bacteroides coprosuis DSM 18011 TaxID=679937 RepID=F3ZRJ3_9BACE|nr:protein tyrosine phosphatase [Bacteroides coprosuis DSM 18011]
MLELLTKSNLLSLFKVDSAGILGVHAGDLPDPRMRKHAARRGYDLVHRSRPIDVEDFYNFDIIIGMDDQNICDLKEIAPSPDEEKKIHRMVEYLVNQEATHIPDPYYGGADGFELVLDLLEDACEGLLTSLIRDN